MIRSTQAVTALQDGCTRLGLPSKTATALVQFLSVKRTHDHFVGSSKRMLRMSPGSKLDQLWHFMLLNTSVSTAVHEQLGGVVEHRGVDSTDLSDESKLLQRLYALNVMRLEGQEPDLELWTEPGTALQTLHLTGSPVPGLQHLPGAGRLYVTPSLTQQQQAQLVQALQLLYTDTPAACDDDMQQGAMDQQAVAHNKGTRVKAAATTAAAAAAPAGGESPAQPATAADGQPAAKRACVGQPGQVSTAMWQSFCRMQAAQQQLNQAHLQHLTQQQQQQQQQKAAGASNTFRIVIKDARGLQVTFKVMKFIRADQLQSAAEVAFDDEPGDGRLLYYSTRRSGPITLGELGVTDGDVFDFMKAQKGC